MDKMLVVVFDREAQAYEGSKALQGLAQEGSITLYSKAVIVREASGEVQIMQHGDMGPIGTAVGMLTGTLIGMFAGPVGIAIGATVGTSGGFLADVAHIGVGEDYLAEVAEYLKPGKAAVVAEVNEDWVLPVDTQMGELGGVVFRRTRKEVLDSVIDRDTEALRTDLAQLKAERDQATGKARVKIQKQVDAAEVRLQTMLDGIEARIETSVQETDAKITTLQEQAAKASGERKARLAARIAELKANQKRRMGQLKQEMDKVKKDLSD